MDYCLNGESHRPDLRAAHLGVLCLEVDRYPHGLSAIVDGYTPTGGAPPYMTYPAGMAFLGPAGVGAMAAGDSQATC